jgi:hypothetical protein
MGYKSSKNGAITVIVITCVLIILLNVCTFAIPFNKVDTAVLVTVYVCTELILLAESGLIIYTIFSEKTPNQKIISLPIAYFGYITLGLQLIATVVFYLCNAFVQVPIWIVILVECVVFAFGIIQIAKGFFFKTRNAEYHENKANTKFMDEFRARLKALVAINTIESVQKNLQDLLDIANGSDPVTSDKTLDSESELLSLLQELDEAIKDGSEENTREAIERTKNTLLERNVLCKANK